MFRDANNIDTDCCLDFDTLPNDFSSTVASFTLPFMRVYARLSFLTRILPAGHALSSGRLPQPANGQRLIPARIARVGRR
jgi:hypothetical protein